MAALSGWFWQGIFNVIRPCLQDSGRYTVARSTKMGIVSWLMGMGCENVSAEEAKRLHGGKDVVLVDVRTPREHSVRNIKGSRFVPLSELGTRHTEIPRDKEVIVFCQNGIRSIMACKMLKKLGFQKVRNMTGGISRW
jgi:rhodanese-related sulfurtransferase